MEVEDRSLEDADAPYVSFRGATLQIQPDTGTEEVASVSSVDKQRIDADGCSNTELTPVSWGEDDARNLFSFRDGIVEQAVKDSVDMFVQPQVDGEIVGSWILTEISIWDAEKERLLLLTRKSILVVKFDFIALKPLDVHRTLLTEVDTIVIGDLVYPSASLVPRLNGLASGVSTVFKGCLLRWSNPSEMCQTAMDVSQFEPRSRNARGLRIMWNKGEPVTFRKKWNPFSRDIPYITFTSHPLLQHKEGKNQWETISYDVETLSLRLEAAVETLDKSSSRCSVQHKPILLDNYLALGSLIHNRNSLGFFKVRGRFSF